ncbi:MAG TPA: hypothetical protein DHW82_05910 [Spirochaetia bacterium]|nr:hypothetical protein [Spirochaetia bacterium]
MKIILTLLLFISLFSCDKIEPGSYKAPVPEVYSAEVIETSSGNLVIENAIDSYAVLFISGKNFTTDMKAKLIKNDGFMCFNINESWCAIKELGNTYMKCKITVASFYNTDCNDNGSYIVRVRNIDESIDEKWSVENVTITIY